jgi:hypothetical protein
MSDNIKLPALLRRPEGNMPEPKGVNPSQSPAPDTSIPGLLTGVQNLLSGTNKLVKTFELSSRKLDSIKKEIAGARKDITQNSKDINNLGNDLFVPNPVKVQKAATTKNKIDVVKMLDSSIKDENASEENTNKVKSEKSSNIEIKGKPTIVIQTALLKIEKEAKQDKTDEEKQLPTSLVGLLGASIDKMVDDLFDSMTGEDKKRSEELKKLNQKDTTSPSDDIEVVLGKASEKQTTLLTSMIEESALMKKISEQSLASLQKIEEQYSDSQLDRQYTRMAKVMRDILPGSSESDPIYVSGDFGGMGGMRIPGLGDIPGGAPDGPDRKKPGGKPGGTKTPSPSRGRLKLGLGTLAAAVGLDALAEYLGGQETTEGRVTDAVSTGVAVGGTVGMINPVAGVVAGVGAAGYQAAKNYGDAENKKLLEDPGPAGEAARKLKKEQDAALASGDLRQQARVFNPQIRKEPEDTSYYTLEMLRAKRAKEAQEERDLLKRREISNSRAYLGDAMGGLEQELGQLKDNTNGQKPAQAPVNVSTVNNVSNNQQDVLLPKATPRNQNPSVARYQSSYGAIR